MPIRLPSYLHRNRFGVFGFRVVIPRNLRVFFIAIEHRISLGTADLHGEASFFLREHCEQVYWRNGFMTAEEGARLPVQYALLGEAAVSGKFVAPGGERLGKCARRQILLAQDVIAPPVAHAQSGPLVPLRPLNCLIRRLRPNTANHLSKRTSRD